MDKKDDSDSESVVKKEPPLHEKKPDLISKSVSSKIHLKGLLKPQSHEATPPPSRPSSSLNNSGHTSSHKPVTSSHSSSNNSSSGHSHSSSSHNHASNKRTHDMMKKADHHRVDSNNPPNKKPLIGGTSKESHHHKSSTSSQLKTPEQIKAEQRKNWTPQQWEEYKRRKEKEKLLYKKHLAENGSRDHKQNSQVNRGKQNVSLETPAVPRIGSSTHDSSARKHSSASRDSSTNSRKSSQLPDQVRKQSGATGSPMKNSKHYKDPHSGKVSQTPHASGKERIYPDIHHRSTLSNADHDKNKNSKKYSSNNLNKASFPKKSLSPPPPPPVFGGSLNKKEPPGIKSNLATPPPPGSVAKYV